MTYNPMAMHTPVHGKKVGRNAPCPCGSGKKFKKMLRCAWSCSALSD